jgi:N-methylhydantoinase A
MIAFGGSGPAHAVRIARKLRVPEVIYPRGSGVMSAIGMLVSPLSFQLARSNRVLVADLDRERFAALFDALQREAEATLFPDATARPPLAVRRFLDMRYRGQGYEIEVELPEVDQAGDLLALLPEKFAAAYETIFSLSYLEEPLEILNWKVEVTGPAPRPGRSEGTPDAAGKAEPRAWRPAYFPESGYVECPVYERRALSSGLTVEGPAFVEERESTVVLGHGDRAAVDRHGNLVVKIGATA